MLRIRTVDPPSTKEDLREESTAVDGKDEKKRWLSRAGKHSMQANRLINVARRMQVMSAVTDLAKRKCNERNIADTLAAYFKEANTRLRPCKNIDNKKDREAERKDGVGKLLQEMLTLDPLNPIHAAKALRAC